MAVKFKSRSQRHQTPRLPIAVREVGTFKWHAGILLNLSSSGVQIHTSAELEDRNQIEIEFVTINRQGSAVKRKMKARVVWKKGERYGCQFTRGAT